MAGLGHRPVGTALSQGEYEAADNHELDGQTAGDLIIAQDATTLTRIPIGVGVLTGDGTDADWEAVVAGLLLSDNDPEDVGTTADEGTGTAASRDDHVHVGAVGLLLSDDDPEDVGSSAAEGTGTTASRDDHVHEYGDLSGLTALTSLASGDKLYLSDVSDSNAVKATTLTSLASQLAGTNLTASGGVLSASGGSTLYSDTTTSTSLTSGSILSVASISSIPSGTYLITVSGYITGSLDPFISVTIYIYRGSSNIFFSQVAEVGNTSSVSEIPFSFTIAYTNNSSSTFSLRARQNGTGTDTLQYGWLTMLKV